MSAEHGALASCRVTAQCFEYGRAAAMATDLSLKFDLIYQDIDGMEIASLMNENYYGQKNPVF